MGNLSTAQEDALTASVPTVVVPTVGWAVAAVLMAIGALLLLFRRGRGLLVFGALIGVATTAWAQFGLGYGGEDAVHQVDQWPLYWGGVVVIVLALLPATGRWVGRQRRVPKSSTVIGTTDSGAILWPGT
jgi:putative Mn2+ efflux pump MntP